MTSRHLSRRMIRNYRRTDQTHAQPISNDFSQLEIGSIAIGALIQMATILGLILFFFGPEQVTALFGLDGTGPGGLDGLPR